jgi:hypothetical protein
MRTTIDIPDETYRKIRTLAAQRGGTIREIVLEGLALVEREKLKPKKRFELPLVPSTRTGKLDIDNQGIYDLIGFP